MALAYLIDPCQQYQNRAGVNNVAGYLEVFRMDTDDRATVYVDFNGTLAPEHIGIDNDGRAVMIVESGRPYRVEMHGPSGELFWTQQPVWPLAGGGGGVSGTDVVSSDGSISVDKTTVGSVTTYDLSANVEDSTDLLNWIRCEGATHIDDGDIWKPTYSAGTMVVGTRGIQVDADQFYHVTAHVRATKTSASPYYDNVYLLYSLDDGTSVTPVTRQSVIVDCSLGLSQDFEFSTDVMAVTDGELLFSIVGQDQAGISFDVLDMELHRVYSGALHLPDGYARADQADWAEDDPEAPSYIRHRPDLSLYVTDSDLETILEGYTTASDLQAGLAAKQDTISDLSAIRAGAQAGATAVQPAALDSYATKVELNTGLSGKQDTINDLSTIRSGAAAGSTALQASDVAEVAVSGNYADLINKPTIPTKTSDLTNDSGFITASGAPVQDVQVDGTSVVNAQGIAEITMPTTGVLDVEVDGTSVVNAQGVAEIDLSGYATTQALTTGLASKQDTISDLATIRSGAAAGASAVQPGDLAAVATTGSYNSLSDKPSIPTVDQAYNASSTNAQSGTAVAQAISSVDAVPDVTSSDSGKVLVATYSGGSGSYAWATTPPANAIIIDSSSTWSDFYTAYSAGRKDIYYKHTNPYPPFDSRAEVYLQLTAVSDVDGSSTNFTFALFEGLWNSSGIVYIVTCKLRYNASTLVFITNLSVDQSYSASSRNSQSGVAVAQAISAVNQVPSSTSSDEGKVLTVDSNGDPEWATAQAPISAGTGIDITNNVVSVDNTVVAMKSDLPTATSDLTNDSGFITLSDVPAQVNADWNSSSGASEILNKPTIPTATSDLTNDSGFITLSDVPAQVNADWDATSGASEILNKPSIPSGAQLVPTATSADADKVLTVNAQGTPEWATGGGDGGADWDAEQGEPGYIENKPVPKTLTAGTGISITENASTITVASTVTAPVRDVTVDGSSVVRNGVAAITTPTVDQTYDASSTNAQSGVAVASAIAAMTYTAGTGISISNNVISEDRTVLWEGTITVSGNSNLNTVIQLSESVLHFERIEVFCDNRINYLTWHPVSGINNTDYPVAYQGLNENTNNDVVLGAAIIQESDYTKIRYRCGYGSSFTTAYRGDYWNYGKPYKVVGIHRIASN